MDIEKLIDEMKEEEKIIYLKSNASSYFHYVFKDNESSLKEKINQSEKLTEEEWKFILEKLFLVTTKAIAEEDEFSIVDSIVYLISRISKAISFKDSPYYNECCKLIEYLGTIKKEKMIHKDLVKGLRIVNVSREETDLDILLRQHEEACIFRDSKDTFNRIYENTSTGIINRSEIMYSNIMKRSYGREKELVKKYYF